MKGISRVFQKQLRRKVSGHRTRFTEGGYDLDLTYVTDSIIAMGLPAAGIRSAWRNPVDDVASLLNRYHDLNYLVYNLSDATYDYEKFNNKVVDFPFPDHYAPPLSLLFHVVLSMDRWLSLDKQNIIAIHCKGGKGRTGVIIACYLIFNGVFDDAKKALNFFAEKRSSTGRGVTQPSQIRYVKYFRETLKKNKPPIARRIAIKKILMNPIPNRTYGRGNGIRPVIRIFSTKKYPKLMIHATHMETRRYSPDKDEMIEWKFSDKELVLEEDVLLKIYHEQKTNKKDRKKMLRVSFHTSFLTGNYLSFPLSQIDQPGSKDFEFPENFTLNFHFIELQARSQESEAAGIAEDKRIERLARRRKRRERMDSVELLPFEILASFNEMKRQKKLPASRLSHSQRVVEAGGDEHIDKVEEVGDRVDIAEDLVNYANRGSHDEGEGEDEEELPVEVANGDCKSNPPVDTPHDERELPAEAAEVVADVAREGDFSGSESCSSNDEGETGEGSTKFYDTPTHGRVASIDMLYANIPSLYKRAFTIHEERSAQNLLLNISNLDISQTYPSRGDSMSPKEEELEKKLEEELEEGKEGEEGDVVAVEEIAMEEEEN